MSEGTDSSVPSSGTEKLEPSAKPKKKLWLQIVAIIVVIALIGTAAAVLMTPKHKIAVTMSPASVTVDAGKKLQVSVSVLFDDADLVESAETKILWDIEPNSLATLDRYGGKMSVSLTGGNAGGDGTITCSVTHKGVEDSASATLKVNDPVFDSVSIDPSSARMAPEQEVNFTATAINSVGGTMTGASFTWTVVGIPANDLDLTPNTGASVKLKVHVMGTGNLTVEGKIGTVTKFKNASLIVGAGLNRTVDYKWYNFFNVPFEPYWDVRWNKTGIEQPITDSYPYIYIWHGAPLGNAYYYSDCRLNITAKNMTEINMNERPEFLPNLGTQKGGNAVIDWHFDYMNHDVIASMFPPSTTGWDDGWFIRFTGTVTLDKQAAMSVLGVTEDGYNNFATWWSTNGAATSKAYQDWLKAEANTRLDIYPMYEYPLTILGWTFSPTKVGDKIVISQDFVSWGMEALLTRWMRESFMPTEWYMYNGDFHMTITPDYANLNYDAAVMYSLYLYETTLVPGTQTHGDPCWVWEALMQDYVKSSVPHPHSDFDVYAPWKYQNTAPGSAWYGKMMDYDYTPGTFNLTSGETLKFEWPAGDQLFIAQAFNSTGGILLGKTINVSAPMRMDYSEPMDVDDSDAYITPGTIVTDNVNRVMTFTGPIDMYNWSKHQTNHTWLANEWARMGMLPYGAPYIEWKMETFVQPHLDHFDVTGMTDPIPAGQRTNVTVTAIDQYGNTFTNYDGTVSFSSSDSGATLPANYGFSPGDAGVHHFVNEVNFSSTARGAQTVTVTDTVTTTATGSASVTVIEPRRADYFVLSGFQAQIVVNETQIFTVTVHDQYDVVFKSYSGTVNFTSNATAATLPSNYTFDPSDSGTSTFGVSFHELGLYSLACTDTSNSSLTGSADNLRVVGERPRIDHFNVYMAQEINPGVGYDVTVVAISQYGDVLDTYNGTVAFSTNASLGVAIVPANYTFVAGDHGNKTFAGGVSFNAAGVYSLTVSDTVVLTATGSITGIVVQAWPEITYKMYDLFEQPFGEWFWSTASYGRITNYYQDYILSNETHKHAWLYAPDPDASEHTVIFAPYRWSIDARNATTLNVHHPEFTYKSSAQGDVAGARVRMTLAMDYISSTEWAEYWIPTWGWVKPDKPWNDTAVMEGWCRGQGDGYQLGEIYNIVMNREAAYEWLGIPLAANVTTWYDNGNQFDFIMYSLEWTTWIDDEGNNRLDIYAGYDDLWYPGFNWMHLEEIYATGEVLLQIGEVDWGTEVLMTRWLTEVNLCPLEPYYEDFTLYANYTETTTDVFIDAVGMYSLRAVRANQSSTNAGAWAFEPTKIDYVSSWSGAAYHPSFFDPYVNLTYKSLNPGDAFFGQEVGYDATPWWFNLSSHQKLIIQLPTSNDVLGFHGQGVGSGSFADAQKGNIHNYTGLMYNGSMSLGYYVSGGVDLGSMYNAATKTLTIDGPVNFDYPRNASTGLLYHGAPWIEFNVSSTMGTLSVVGPTEAAAPTSSSSGTITAGSASLVASVMVAALAVAALGVMLRRRE